MVRTAVPEHEGVGSPARGSQLGILTVTRAVIALGVLAAHLWAQAPARDFLSHREHGKRLLASGEFDQAGAEFQAALRLDPRSHEIRNYLGLCWVGKNDPAAAVKEFREALRLKSDYVEARSNLGAALLRNGNPRAAEAELRLAAEQAPSSPDIYYRLLSLAK